MGDSSNKFCVTAYRPTPDSDGCPLVEILNLPLKARTENGGGALPLWPAPAPLRLDEAINLAAWIVAMTGRRAEFLRLLEEIERS
jgi:hypothetical protein